MADDPATGGAAAPAPEELKPQSATAVSGDTPIPDTAATTPPKGIRQLRRGAYRPSHRATFIGLTVVVLILAINAGLIAFVLKSQNNKANSQANQAQVSINQDALSKLGVNDTAVGDQGIQLTVNPNAKFNGTLQVGGDVSIGGAIKSNNTITASAGNLTQLQAGNTQLSQLNVNGDGTVSNLNLRKNLTVAGTTTLQGSATFSDLVTANSGLNVVGNLSVGGALAVGTFQATNLTVSHIFTTGALPSVSHGSALGTGGTASISGNDAAGTIFLGAGFNASSGIVATVSFRNAYSSTPHVIVTPIGGLGSGITYYVTSRTTAGFSIGVYGNLNAGGYTFDYIVEQ